MQLLNSTVTEKDTYSIPCSLFVQCVFVVFAPYIAPQSVNCFALIICQRLKNVDITSVWRYQVNSYVDQGRLSLSTDGDKCAMINFGESERSLILNFNIQKCEFCAQI